MPTFWGYARVSDKKQVEKFSLESQVRRIRDYYEYLKRAEPNLEWGGVIEDPDSSAYKVQFACREKGIELIQQLQPGDHICFAYLDRGFRNTVDCLNTVRHWRDSGITVHFLDMNIDTSTPFGEAFLTMAAAFAQLDSRLKSQRVKEGMRRRRAKMQPMWGRGKLHPDKRIVAETEDGPIVGENRKHSAYCRLLSWWKSKGAERRDLCRNLEEIIAEHEMRQPAPLFKCKYKSSTIVRMLNQQAIRDKLFNRRFNEQEIKQEGVYDGLARARTNNEVKRFTKKVQERISHERLKAIGHYEEGTSSSDGSGRGDRDENYCLPFEGGQEGKARLRSPGNREDTEG